MKYDTLQQAHRLVDELSQADRDLLKPFLPVLPEQKTLSEIINDVYKAYMCEEDKANGDRLDEIYYQLKNLAKVLPAREFMLHPEDYEELPEGSVVLGSGSPWVKGEDFWHNAFSGFVSDEDMAGEPREVIRKGQGYVC